MLSLLTPVFEVNIDCTINLVICLKPESSNKRSIMFFNLKIIQISISRKNKISGKIKCTIDFCLLNITAYSKGKR